MHVRLVSFLLAFFAALGPSLAAPPPAAPTLEALKVSQPPRVDGLMDEPDWARAPELVTHDPIAGIDLRLRAVYTDESIFVLVQFPDPTEDLEQKTLVWHRDLQLYKIGPKREDTLVLKWNMENEPVDLRLDADAPYQADIWYWKACRTQPMGYADDKMQVYSNHSAKDAKRLISKSGRTFFLRRPGDAGNSAYQVVVAAEFSTDTIPRYQPREPTGSRADIRSKGVWRDGEWTVEFGRRLNTGHLDDVQFHPGETYLFGVSRYEIAGRQPDPSIDQPNFGSGEISEHLLLVLR